MSNEDWFVYLVRCKDNSLYCGITKNLEKRINDHNTSQRGAKYTRSRRPVSLVWHTQASNRSSALRLEHRIKKLSKKEKELLASGKKL